ncbi:hypothetical protein KIN20_008836 [Parelaphostrongylus tenuis]|uniref:Galectin n=1 Tax=Parelaphostrongylus tenuis TaxID=148309 RepID=A0AAD5M7C7_PARTN|nr:hypothetical protein KIN20_008836 [Parelaphostrongylus tenuis]
MNSWSYGSWRLKISVNGHHLAPFQHRFPVEAVQAIGTKGDVYIEKSSFAASISIEEDIDGHVVDWHDTSDYGHEGYCGNGTTAYMPPVSVPKAIPIIEPLRYGCKIDIHGKVDDCCHKNFAVELSSGPHIVLHINFRFHREYMVVMNSASYGNWGDEVRRHHSLHHNDSFHLHIQAHHDHYEIELNALGLKGDFTIEKVRFSGFQFNLDWNSECDYGHRGYSAYGTDDYEPPCFDPSHSYNAYF